ncbi:MAG: phosphodiester glycosidase family protein [Verrucomicrobiota bacterium]
MRNSFKFTVFGLMGALKLSAQANTYVDPVWSPIYQGIEYFHGVSGSVHVYAVKVDLQNPNVELYASHDNGSAANEVLTETGSVFNSAHNCKVSVNASYCDVTSTGQAAANVDVWGLGISDGVVVSPGATSHGSQYNCQMLFTAAKAASIALSQTTPGGIHTAVTGNAYHLVDGLALGATTGPTQRTSFGLSQDKRYLYMACVTSATIYNLSLWMLDLGAWDAVNMDGGGSTCMTRADIGKVYPAGTERRVGVHLGVRSIPLSNPPYLFDSGTQGFTPGNSASAMNWINTGWPGWPGVLYFDQTGNDSFIYGPSCAFTGSPAVPQVVQVGLYEQNGSGSAHDMQVFWKSVNYNWWDGAFSSPAVSFTSQNTWTAVNLNVDNGYWHGQTINQLRLDFDNTNHSTRHIVNHVIVQDQLQYMFESGTEGWFAGNSLTAPFWWTAAGWPGMLVVDQTGADAFMYGPLIGGAFNYLGGANDKIHIRLFPVGGSPVHNMQAFWIQDGNQSWDGAKSSVVVNYTADNQWADVYIPVGQNPLWGTWGQIQELRLDLDNGNNTGCRYHIDYIRVEQ